MSEQVDETIEIPVTLTKADYLRYFAIAARHQRKNDWTNLWIYAAAYFAAIPVAVLFRWLALGEVDDDTITANLIGRYSLIAFFLGAVTMVLAMIVMRRRAVDKTLAGTLNAFGPKVATLDTTGVTLTGQISHASWRWGAISRFVADDGFLLLWIGQSSVVAISDRSFATAGQRDAAIAFIYAQLAGQPITQSRKPLVWSR